MDGESGLGCFLSTFSPPWPTPPQTPFYTHHKHLFPSPLLSIHSNLPPSSPYHTLISIGSSPKSCLFSLSMEKDFFPWTQNPATFPIDMSFYTTSSNWDQHDPFESALSSMVSSPAASATPAAVCGGGSVQLIELIGKLGSICSPSEISPHHSFIPINQNNQSGNNSCYSTPLNSPPKLDYSNQVPAALTPFSTDPGFAERAARFSCFGSRSFNVRSQLSVNDAAELSNNKLHRVASCHFPKCQIQPDSKDESYVSQKVQSNGTTGGGGRKRKSAPRGKGKESQSSKVGADSNESGTKWMKSDEMEKSGKSAGDGNGNGNENSKPPEPPKDYIHVRARRGQATDSHSLAERVRREKISERMKFLQDLVPGCNKVTGKAVMLDEIINYVQSLQRQVEFLSMKLATVNPRMDSVEMEALLSKEILESQTSMYPVTSSNSASAAFPYAYPSQELQQCMSNAATESQFCNNLSINGFCNSASQVSMWEDELHNVVQMGFASGSMEPSQMKMEP